MKLYLQKGGVGGGRGSPSGVFRKLNCLSRGQCMPELPQGRAGPCDQGAWDEGARPSLFGSRKGSRWLGFLWKCSPSLLPNAQSPGWKQGEVPGLLRLELAPCLAPQAIPWTEPCGQQGACSRADLSCNLESQVHAAECQTWQGQRAFMML